MLSAILSSLGLAQPITSTATSTPTVGVHTGEPTANSSTILRHRDCANGIQTTPFENMNNFPRHQTLYPYFAHAAETYATCNCLGWRKTKDTPYEFMTYSQVHNRVETLSTNMGQKLNLKPKTTVAVFSINRPEWLLTMWACWRQGMVVIPLYDTLGPSSGRFILNDAKVQVVFVSGDNLTKLCENIQTMPDTVRHLVYFDKPTEEQCRTITDSGKNITLHDFSDLLNSDSPTFPAFQAQPDDLAYIMYTSGTTGDPKGVMLSHKNVLASSSSLIQVVGDINQDDVYFSYLPLAHSFEGVIITALLFCGASIGFYSGDVKRMMDDVQELKPTIFAGVPRVYTRVYSTCKSELEKQNWFTRTIFDYAFEAQLASLNQGLRLLPLDYMVFSQFANKFGGRVRLMATAGAPMDANMMDFLRVCFCCEVLQGYGLTENMGAACITPRGTTLKNQGEPLPCCEIKLVDVPDLEYSHTDEPEPRGEVYIRGTNVFVGYHNQEEKTREVFDHEGWMKSGDIGKFNQDGSLEIIDRKKNVFKLSQGEYVAAEELEGLFHQSKFLSQIWIYGNSYHDYLVAVVVPEPKAVKEWARSNHEADAEDFARVAKSDKLKQAILDEFKRLGREHQTASFKIPRDIIVETEMDEEYHGFNVKNDCLTPTMKLRRAKLLEKYRQAIDKIYGIESNKENQSGGKKDSGSKLQAG